VTLTHTLVLFDGHCNLCNGTIQTLIKLDKKDQLRFASLQSEYGQSLIKTFQIPEGTDSIICIAKEKAYLHSDAALEIAYALGGIWKITQLAKLLPVFFRDNCYKWVAKHRYQFFGRTEHCLLPSPELSKKFLSTPPQF
jgi:predicted DCC family thiol-disulfide oxidoreductase YuxK